MPCLAYFLEAREEIIEGDADSATTLAVPFDAQTDACDFLVEDPSGVALVRVEHALVAFAPTDVPWTRAPAVRHRDFLLARGRPDPILSESSDGGRYLAYSESTLIVSEGVTIWGFAERVPDRAPAPPSGNPFRSVASRCVISGSTERPVYVFQDQPLGLL